MQGGTPKICAVETLEQTDQRIGSQYNMKRILFEVPNVSPPSALSCDQNRNWTPLFFALLSCSRSHTHAFNCPTCRYLPCIGFDHFTYELQLLGQKCWHVSKFLWVICQCFLFGHGCG